MPEGGTARRVAQVGRVLGPVLGVAAWILLPESFASPDGEAVALGREGRAAAAVAAWMATWWLTEAIPIAATALLPVVLLPVLGDRPVGEVTAPYGHPLIFLFFGGFVLSLAMQRQGLHRRIALEALSRVGSRPDALVAGFMGVTAVLSMWVSNTATALMMLPVAISVVDLAREEVGAGGAVAGGTGAGGTGAGESGVGGAAGAPHSKEAAVAAQDLGPALLLGLAYAASIGGVGTIIGSPPNGFFASYVSQRWGRPVGFVQWMAVGLPLVIVFLPLAWLLLTRVLQPVGRRRLPGVDALVREERADLGPASPGERRVFLVFVFTALAWVTRPLLNGLSLGGVRPLAALSDAGIAVAAAVVLFVLPDGRGGRVMNWESTRNLPWGVLVLFGGGLSLAQAIDDSGLGAFLGSSLAGLSAVPAWVLVGAVAAMVVFLTELTSNTATAATFIPILAAVAEGMGRAPVSLMAPAALAASCAFMLPVATPPNAIVFASGRLTVPQMARAGLWLNLVAVVLVTAVGLWLAPRVFG